MSKTALKEIKIKLPVDVIGSVSSEEIIKMLVDKALNKMEYYRSKSQEMEEVYRTKFNNFKKKVEKSKRENFKEWDDLIVWEGYELAYKEWKKNYEELKHCIR
jgi:hypothetical protein